MAGGGAGAGAGSKEVEMGCGWCKIPLKELTGARLGKMTRRKETLQGGTPFHGGEMIGKDDCQRGQQGSYATGAGGAASWRRVLSGGGGMRSPELHINAHPPGNGTGNGNGAGNGCSNGSSSRRENSGVQKHVDACMLTRS